VANLNLQCSITFVQGFLSISDNTDIFIDKIKYSKIETSLMRTVYAFFINKFGMLLAYDQATRAYSTSPDMAHLSRESLTELVARDMKLKGLLDLMDREEAEQRNGEKALNIPEL
jgi:hypothetical protein